MSRTSPAVLVYALLALGCGPQESEPAQQVAVVEPEPEPPPAPIHTEPQPVVPEGCSIVVRGGDDIEQAAVDVPSQLIAAEVIGGHELQFECPPVGERKGAAIIASRSQNEVVHWPDVDLGEPGSAITLEAADALDNLPELAPDHREVLRSQMPGLALWAEESDAPEDLVDRRVSVLFTANELPEAELKIRGQGVTKKIKLAPSSKKRLEPGVYKLSFKLSGADWQDAGKITIKPGIQQKVRMLEAPPWSEVSPP